MKNAALVVVDMLYDFIDGSLACLNAENAVDNALKFIDLNTASTDTDDSGIHSIYPILFVCDHHPADHSSFKEYGGIWPAHCVAGTKGGSIHEKLEPYSSEEFTFFKGEDRLVEQYSGFEGVNAAGQSMSEVLDLMGIEDVYVCGIATEYCVKNSCMDLLKAGYKVHVCSNSLGYVSEEGHREALEEMKSKGIHVFAD